MGNCVKLIDKKKCSGCGVCRAICRQGAISMSPDIEGFLYPVIDEQKCVNCGACTRICPSANAGSPRKPHAVYAANADDTALRLASSSGGVFTLLARSVLAKGGIVFGVAWDSEFRGARVVSAENEEQLVSLRGSKYVQADADAYERVRKEVESGRQVLYSGTPCQVAALLRMLGGMRHENLLTVDLICHGVPSPLAFRKYAERRESVAGGKIVRIFSRSKNCSWRRYAMSIEFHSTDIAYHGFMDEDPFLRGFLSELYNRPSCHQCQARELRSGSDLTIADYWGVDRKFPDMDDGKGTSAVIVNTQLGDRAFRAVLSLCRVKRSTYRDIAKRNPALCRSPVPHSRRNDFFRQVVRTDDFDALVSQLLAPRKIGIMTWWHNANYGGFLQAIALQTFLSRRGHDVELIDFTFPNYRLSKSRLVRNPRYCAPCMGGVQALISIFVDFGTWAQFVRLMKTKRLFRRYAVKSPKKYRSLAALDNARRYGTIVVGSDQVWNPAFQDKEFSSLLRLVRDDVRKISYAASVAASSVHPYEYVYGAGLKRFHAISVREGSSVPELERLSGKPVEWVVDPTLLLDADEWRSLLGLKQAMKGRHLTFYWLSDMKFAKLREVKRLAKSMRCRVHIFTDWHISYSARTGLWARLCDLCCRVYVVCSSNMSFRLSADARDLVQDISTAEYVVSDSFHALMFATIFGCDAKIDIPPSRKGMGARIMDFQALSAESLSVWRRRSAEWLINSLGA